MTIKISPIGRIDVAEVSKLEDALGTHLPGDYRDFLSKYNGGYPEPNVSQTGPPGVVGVHVFYGILDGERVGEDLLYQRNLLVDRVPANILPIGADDFGNKICLSLRPESYGSIFFWDHELEADEGEPATFENMIRVGGSFYDFLQGLKPDPIILKPGQKPGQGKNVWVAPGFLEELKALEEKKKPLVEIHISRKHG